MAAEANRSIAWATNAWARVFDSAISESQSILLEQTFKLSDFSARDKSTEEQTPILECEYDVDDFCQTPWWGEISRHLSSLNPAKSFVASSVKGMSIAFGDTSEFKQKTHSSELHCWLFVNQSWSINDGGCVLLGDGEPTHCVAPRVCRMLAIGPSANYSLTTPSRYATAMLMLLHISLEYHQ